MSQERSGRVKAKPWELLQAAGQSQPKGRLSGLALLVAGAGWSSGWFLSAQRTRAGQYQLLCRAALPVGMGMGPGGVWHTARAGGECREQPVPTLPESCHFGGDGSILGGIPGCDGEPGHSTGTIQDLELWGNQFGFSREHCQGTCAAQLGRSCPVKVLASFCLPGSGSTHRSCSS